MSKRRIRCFSPGPRLGSTGIPFPLGWEKSNRAREKLEATTLLRLALLFVLWTAVPTSWAQKFITVASTTSTEQSGLFKHLLPAFTKKTGIEVRVVALGTGQAIALAQKGDADVLFVHHKPSEEKFVAEGWGVKRLEVMYNDFVVV